MLAGVGVADGEQPQPPAGVVGPVAEEVVLAAGGRQRAAEHGAGGHPLVGQPEAGHRQAGERGQLVGDPGGGGAGQRALRGDDRQRVEQLQREGLRRVDERLLRRAALAGDLVERGGDRLGVGDAGRAAARARSASSSSGVSSDHSVVCRHPGRAAART